MIYLEEIVSELQTAIPETNDTLVRIGFIAAAFFLVMSVVLFVVMGRDKRLAKSHRYRIPESRLFLLAVLGGALGGVLGMQIFRHKTAHAKFVVGFPLLALLQWGAVIYAVIPN